MGVLYGNKENLMFPFLYVKSNITFYTKYMYKHMQLHKTGVINDLLGQPTDPASSDCCLILKFWDGQTDDMCENNDHYRPGLWSA